MPKQVHSFAFGDLVKLTEKCPMFDSIEVGTISHVESHDSGTYALAEHGAWVPFRYLRLVKRATPDSIKETYKLSKEIL